MNSLLWILLYKKKTLINTLLYWLLFVQILKTLVVALLVAGVIPLLLGLLFELVIVAPLRVPLDQTPLFYPWQVLLIVSQACTAFYLNMSAVLIYFLLIWHLQDWALGVLHAKIIAAITLMGPQWWLKTVIEQVGFISVILQCHDCVLRCKNCKNYLQVYANGIRNIDLQFIIRKLAAPVISVLLLALCVPYVIAAGVVPAVGGLRQVSMKHRGVRDADANEMFAENLFIFVGVTPEMEILMQRRIYPFLLMVVLLIGILSFQIRQFKRLYEHIKNDK